MRHLTCLIKSILPAPEHGKFLRIVCQASRERDSPDSETAFPHSGQSARLFPGNCSLRLKSVLRGDLPGEYEITVKGVRRAALKVGGILVAAELPVEECQEALLLVGDKAFAGLGNSPVRIHGGLHEEFNTVAWGVFISEAQIRPYRATPHLRLMHLRLSKPCPLSLGAELKVSREVPSRAPGGSHAPGNSRVPERTFAGKIALLGMAASANRTRKSLPVFLSGTRGSVTEQIIRINMALRDFVLLPPCFNRDRDAMLSEGRGSNMEMIPPPGREKRTIQEPVWLITRRKRESISRHILKTTRRCGGVHGMNIGENLREAAPLPAALLLAIAREMVDIQEKGGWFFSVHPVTLPPLHRFLLEKVRHCGYNGLPVKETHGLAEGRALEEMKRSGFVCGGEALWLSRETMEEIAVELLRGMERGRELAIMEVKDRLGGNRVFRIEVLSILEEEGRLSTLRDSVRTVQ